MNNLMRSLMAMLFLGGLFFYHTDEPYTSRPKILESSIVVDQAPKKMIHFGIAQKQMQRLNQSSSDDRNL